MERAMPQSTQTKDKLLFTPGPLTTSLTVKQAALRDLGSRDQEFIAMVRTIRRKLLELGGVADRGFEAILMQGSGTFAIESVLSSTVPPDGKVLAVINGAYGRRIAQIAQAVRIPVTELSCPEDQRPDRERLSHALEADPSLSHVAVVHSETSTGMINPVREIGEIVKHFNRIYFVDAMSSFGGMPLNLLDCRIDYLVSSANKCLEGIPGFAFVLAQREALLATAGFARSVSLDVLAQWKGLEADGQFRFTPPTHALLAFHQALRELEAEGGVEGRAARYRTNFEVLSQGMRELGFEGYLRPEDRGYIISSFRYPRHPKFDFGVFYARLSDKGFVIYPGKVSKADCFRIGCIGHIFPENMRGLLGAIRQTLAEMGVEIPAAVST
jgi:2-aminoethylphosphonate-pyruvate transaminase